MSRRSVRVKRSLLASFGSGKRKPVETHEDDELEFFDIEIPQPTICEWGKFQQAPVERVTRCLWCFTILEPDDKGRYGRKPCPNCRHYGTTNLEMREIKHVYVEEYDPDE